MILDFFNAPPGDYQVVFTKGATGALKIVGETFPWSDGSVFRYCLLMINNINSNNKYVDTLLYGRASGNLAGFFPVMVSMMLLLLLAFLG
jgi:hypothetical protein